MALVGQDVLTRFWSKVQHTEYCWRWTGAIIRNGYGNFYANKRNVLAHRFAFELARGPIPPGKVIDHLCRNRACVRPSHMEVVDSRTNTLRGNTKAAANLRKIACKRGHPFSAENTYRNKRKRYCRICGRASTKAYQARRSG